MGGGPGIIFAVTIVPGSRVASACEVDAPANPAVGLDIRRVSRAGWPDVRDVLTRRTISCGPVEYPSVSAVPWLPLLIRALIGNLDFATLLPGFESASSSLSGNPSIEREQGHKILI